MHKCVICIGTNYNRGENLLLAREKLSELFPSICFTPGRETKPLYFRNPAFFFNQVAVFATEKEEEEVRKILKAIEQFSGRCSEDKERERVPLDIDLLTYDDKILKPEDWQREYIQKELSQIPNS